MVSRARALQGIPPTSHLSLQENIPKQSLGVKTVYVRHTCIDAWHTRGWSTVASSDYVHRQDCARRGQERCPAMLEALSRQPRLPRQKVHPSLET